MHLISLHIISFGGITNRDFDLSPGVNVFEGENESGKSSAAMFVKFIFAGLSSKGGKTPSERQRYINTSTGQAAGYIMAKTDAGKTYRIERAIITSDSSPARERVRIIDQSSGDIVTGQNPCEYFFGVTPEVFVSTCFLAQSADAKPEIGSFGQSSKGGAIGNLLTSADESTDVKTALEKLTSLRRSLLHKNGSGGEIASLREKRGALLAEMKSQSDKASEILSVSTSLDDITRRIAELEEADSHYTELFSALEKINVKRQIETAAQAEKRTASLTESIEALDSSPLGEGAEEALLESERDIRAYDELCAAFDELSLQFEEADDGELPEENEIIAEVHSADSSARIQFSAAIALIIAGAVGLAASFMLYYFNTDLYIFPLLVTLILIILGVTFMIRYSGSKRKLNELLEEWNAESADEIETAVYEKMHVLSRRQKLAEDRERLTAALNVAKMRFDAAEERIRSMSESASLPETGDIYEAVSALHKICGGISAERSQMKEKLAKYSGKLELLREQLQGVDPASAELEAYTVLGTDIGKEADRLSPEEIKKAAAERDFTVSALKSALKRKSALEERMAELGKLTRTPDECATLISSVETRIEELTLRHEACTLAEQAIREAGDAVQSDVVPKIAEAASAILRSASPHEKIVLDSSFDCGTLSGDRSTSSCHLSRGTADLVYISLRIALSRELCGEETPVLLFDESFSHIDTQRLKSLVRSLTDGQFVLFTCRRDEAEIAGSVGANVIHLA